MTISQFVETLVVLDAMYPFSIHSWKRTAYHNASVEGHENSRHLLWLAIDVTFDEPLNSNKKARRAFIKECRRQGLKALDEGDHIHLQTW